MGQHLKILEKFLKSGSNSENMSKIREIWGYSENPSKILIIWTKFGNSGQHSENLGKNMKIWVIF